MNHLIVSATVLEIQSLTNHFQIQGLEEGSPVSIERNGHQVTFLITGVGMMHCAYYLSDILRQHHYDNAIQVGIAGAFDRSIQIGEVVRVRSQQFGDLGVIENNGFSDVFDMELMDSNASPFQKRKLINNTSGHTSHQKLQEVSSVSVNQISSEAERIALLQSKYHPQIEVMEGVAFHFACLKAGQSYAEIRGISNYVEQRNKENWDIRGAVEQVNNYLLFWLKEGSG